MWFLRRRPMLRIAWTDKVSNEEVLQRANTSRNLLNVIVNRQIRFVGHIMRKQAIALTGMIEGKRAVGNNGRSTMAFVRLLLNSLKICQERNEHILIANVRV